MVRTKDPAYLWGATWDSDLVVAAVAAAAVVVEHGDFRECVVALLR